MKKQKKEEICDYCPRCGTCGFIECCGITRFLEKHVKGKTNCPNEDLILNDLISLLNTTLRKEMKQDYLIECERCKSKQCSGWHRTILGHSKSTIPPKK